ncbi:uncharacterized protein EKO05_0008729 [Ascochyta rabiei]|uniref:uncharacterized protein n=1 Tax=Didymella rabiei TaxID=5454 RepID=UPI0021FFA6FA|nr:uncharacterized protein EKO05_0008729 [Ascochyta rabiei]UPX18429.1 hypothetical protein EKO05_0008729 [Ascochyta rabiei]
MFVLLLAMTSLGVAARRLRQDSQDGDKTRSPPATELHPLRAFLLSANNCEAACSRE